MDNQEKTDKKIFLDIHFLKNNDYRTVFASGVFGGVTPNGLVNINFFTDRAPLPNKITYEIDPQNPSLKKEAEREGRKGFVREVHFGVVLDKETTKLTIAWLTEQLANLEK